jgi:putative SOS response-associated peptidase YedK
MCGRFTLESAGADLSAEFGLPGWPIDRPPRYNIAPTQEVAAIVRGADGDRLAWPRWGLVPFWADDERIGSRMINARAETVAEKPAFRTAFRRRRCMVLCDGFYEWRVGPDGKAPFRIRLRGGTPFGLAGLWEQRERNGEPPLVTCTILTTAANAFMRPIHDRMPVILPRADRERWLDIATPLSDLVPLLSGDVQHDFEAWQVSSLVNSPRNDVPECCAPV